MEYWIKLIDKATDAEAIVEIVEERAAFDETISNEEYFDIFEYASKKILKLGC